MNDVTKTAAVSKGTPTPEIERLREQYGIDPADNMLATGDDLDWLIRQLAAWPNRVHEDKTTNNRFLRESAALTLAALQSDARTGGGPRQIVPGYDDAALADMLSDAMSDIHDMDTGFGDFAKAAVRAMRKEIGDE